MAFIKPTFDNISVIQDRIEVYKTEHDKVASVNEKLASMVRKTDGVSGDSENRLATYLPDEIDDIVIQRDLMLIIEEAGIKATNVSYEGPGSKGGDTGGLSNSYSFSVSLEGSYEQIKHFFDVLERNNYPLEVSELSVSESEEGFLSAEVKLKTYSFKDEALNKEIEI
ncbi:MAG: hypothetical protein H6782_00800 [Candidatus Nomurabacteria bacterium]|nr:MAG: hypothetical protein H6782_00800 [Candidatus Nomurabacteria bacterium]